MDQSSRYPTTKIFDKANNKKNEKIWKTILFLKTIPEQVV